MLLPFGTLIAARLNAEHQRDYDVDRFLNWCFGISDCRGGWGVTIGRWGDYDCDGLVGSIDNRGGYAFAMNTSVTIPTPHRALLSLRPAQSCRTSMMR